MARLRAAGVAVLSSVNFSACSTRHGALSFLLPEMKGELKGQSSISLTAGEDLLLSWETEVEGIGCGHGLGYPGGLFSGHTAESLGEAWALHLGGGVSQGLEKPGPCWLHQGSLVAPLISLSQAPLSPQGRWEVRAMQRPTEVCKK